MTRADNEAAQNTRYWLTPAGWAAADEAQHAIDTGELEPVEQEDTS